MGVCMFPGRLATCMKEALLDLASPQLPSGLLPFFLLFGKGSDSFKVNQKRTPMLLFALESHWAI